MKWDWSWGFTCSVLAIQLTWGQAHALAPESKSDSDPSEAIAAGPDHPAYQRFDRVMALSGGNLNVPMHIAQYDAVTLNRGPVDILFGNCGGSIAAAIIKIIPDRDRRRDFLVSPVFHQFLRSYPFADIRPLELQNYLTWFNRMAKAYKAGLASYRLPELFGLNLVALDDVPFPSWLDQPFEQEGDHQAWTSPRIVIMASKMLVDPRSKEVVKKVVPDGTKYFKEVYLTDPDTAQYLQGLKSFTGQVFPDSVIAEDTEVITGLSLAEAVRASVADPVLAAPAFLHGDYFTTGAIDPDPSMLLSFLGKESILRYTGLMGELAEAPVMYATYKYNANKLRYYSYEDHNVSFWIDMSAGDMPNLKPALTNPQALLWLGDLKLRGDIPKDLSEFADVVRGQYSFAYRRTVEALGRKKGSRNHIRKRIRYYHTLKF